jgi:hypothetical protein
MVEHPDVAVAVSVPLAIFAVTVLVTVAWLGTMWMQGKVKDAERARQQQAKQEALKARQ